MEKNGTTCNSIFNRCDINRLQLISHLKYFPWIGTCQLLVACFSLSLSFTLHYYYKVTHAKQEKHSQNHHRKASNAHVRFSHVGGAQTERNTTNCLRQATQLSCHGQNLFTISSSVDASLSMHIKCGFPYNLCK